jgi:hypothetical protein
LQACPAFLQGYFLRGGGIGIEVNWASTRHIPRNSGHGFARTIPQFRQAEVTPEERYANRPERIRGRTMMFRWPFRGAILALGLLLTLSVGAPVARACEGTECQPEGKPLDLKKFLREQATSTRTPEAMKQTRGGASRHKHSARASGAHENGKPRHAGHRVVTAASEHGSRTAAVSQNVSAAAPVPTSAQDDVRVVSENEVNDIDRAATPQTAETTGKASGDVQATQSAAPDVQMVVASDFNEIDRKAAEQQPAPATSTMASETAPPKQAPPQSWIQWLWSTIGAGFLALAGLTRYPAA